ncbi:MAG: response regulator [Candidatus Omnitrophica bacterium]|nr:response regulator [Candidatus Omnitrophota bacterium]
MSRKILIVDDDADFREEFCDYLQDYEVVEASNGIEALKLLKRANEISLVILDIMMPGVSGLDVLSEIKKTDPELKIIILTGHSSKDVAIEALKAHADDFIEKPLNPEKINEIIEGVLADKRGSFADMNISSIESKIQKAKDFTENNCFKKITLKEVSQSVYLSPKYFSRIFKKYTGTGFSDYKLKIKVKKAKELLGKPGYNINQISERLGYENAESFIRQFKKITSVTPTEYRKKYLKKRKSQKRKK